ncbi:MAG: hypothetical protein DRO93_10450 [Candidatus Thorarchaeota archaeon]|nr:MAG: hypothetical protein DRO93_10450 [Candidatus Thorarchaeota archaeon]
MEDEKQLLELCKFAVSQAHEYGATKAETQAQFSSELEGSVELGQISSVNRQTGTGIAIRVFVGKQMGSAFTNIPTQDGIRDAVRLAVSAAKVSTEDPDFVDLPLPSSSYPSVDGLWSDSAAGVDPGEVVGQIVQLVKEATQSEAGLVPAMSGAGAVEYHTAYANSNGVDHWERGTVGYIYLGAVAPSGEGMTPIVLSFDVKRGVDYDISSVVQEVADTLRLCKVSASGESGKFPVMMHAMAYGQIMQHTLLESIRGDSVVRGKSRIGDKLGETIAAENLTISDDGTYPGGMNTRVADDEGVPRRRTTIIEHGVLRSFIWDTYWANKAGVASTGNARRQLRRGLVEVATTNVVVEPGRRNAEDILSEIKHGFFVQNVQGAHSSNPQSGDFSIVGNPAILVRDGEMVGQVHGLMLTGNVFDLLKHVGEVASEPRFLEGAIAPDILFTEVNVVCRQ